MKQVIEQYGMHGMTRQKLRQMIGQHIGRKSKKSRLIVAAAFVNHIPQFVLCV